MPRTRSQIGAIGRAGLALAATLAALGAGRARAADTFAWTPGDAPAVTLGREVTSRFELTNLVEITVEVDNAFSAANRDALLGAEQRLLAVPGVRRVFGPARLLDLSIDGGGKPAARAVLARGTSESDGEAARQRVVRRADALGWFVSANGRFVRFLLDTADVTRARGEIAAALVTSGLGLAQPPAGDDGLGVRRLAPDPRARGAPWLPAAISAAWVLFIAVAGFKARPFKGALSTGGVTAIVVAAALGAAAPFALVPVGGVRLAGAMAAAAAAAAALLGLLLERRRGPRPGAWTRFARPPRSVVVLALAPMVACAVRASQLRVGTHQWSEAPLLFVDVRADIDQPVVLQEIERLTEFLRAQPGVESAWSVADLFMGVDTAGEEASRIPPDAEQVRQVLVQARTDPAVALELAADHREALVVVRFDEGDEGSTDRLDLVERLGMYVAAELRAWLLPVDLRAPDLPAVTRGVAKGLLASDTRARILAICERSGRPLTPAEVLAVERVARQAAAVPGADQARLRTELGDDAREFLARYPVPLRAAEQARLVGALVALPDDATMVDVSYAVAATFGERLSARVLEDTAAILSRRLAAVRWRHTARINFHDMLYGAELPTEGVLADEVRSATLQGMGPAVGIPVAPSSPGARHVEAVAVGGAANDRALSDAWSDGLRRGGAVVVAWGVLLLLAGGAAALGWLPLALAPAAAAALPAVLLGEPLGLWSLAFLAGALAAGAVIAMASAGQEAAVRRARVFVLAAAAMLVASCAGPPWFMGSPLDGKPSIPDGTAKRSVGDERAAAATSQARGETVLELKALVALDALERLTPANRARLVGLLERRAAEFHAMGRAIPESNDLERLARLAPPRGAGLLAERADARRAAGDAWLAIGGFDEARVAYDRAIDLGATEMDFRVRALWGHPPPDTTSLAELRVAIAQLPLRAVPPLVAAYVKRGGGNGPTLTRGLAAARQEHMEALALRIGDALRVAARPDAPRVDGEGAGGADGGVPDAGAPDAPDDVAAADAADAADVGDAGDAGDVPDASLPPPVPVPADLDLWVLRGFTISGRLLPLVKAHPELLADLTRALGWVDLLLAEDETSPEILELAAIVFGRAARFGGTERMLMELAYASSDRAEGLARGAAVWESLGRRREACAQWIRAARWRDEPEDPLWRTAVACARREPDVADWKEIRGYVLGRARPDRRAALAELLDAAAAAP